MTNPEGTEFGDPTTAPFWKAAREHRLVVQRCLACGHHQFYPRPFCLECESDRVAWVDCSGRGRIYSMTTVRVQIAPDHQPPYRVAIVRLEEGPQILAALGGGECQIGDSVRAVWRDRADAPPLVGFEPAGAAPVPRQ